MKANHRYFPEDTPGLRLGVLGNKLGHSLSPEIHTELLRRQDLEGTYLRCEADNEEVKQILEQMKIEKIMGMNVTIPYKELLCSMVDVLDECAEAIGAVNTVLQKDGIFYGYNTDHIGAVKMFEKSGVSLDGRKIVLLGSGGACKALVYGFHNAGAARITIAARNQNALQRLKAQFPYIEICGLDDIPSGDIIINTTPVGMYPNVGESIVGPEVLRRFRIASDIVYNPLITEFLRLAQEEGLQIVTGLRMLVDQAIASEEIWLDTTIDDDASDVILEQLSKRF